MRGPRGGAGPRVLLPARESGPGRGVVCLGVGGCRGHRGKGRPWAVTEPRSACLQRAECEELLVAAAFEDCEGRVPRQPFVQACVQDRCHCPDGPSCACSTLAEFSRQCSHAGGRPGNWRTAEFCRKCHGAAGMAGEAGAPGALSGVPSGNVLLRCLPHSPPLGVCVRSGACLCPSSQELPREHGLPGERLTLRGHLLPPGEQPPVRGAPHGWLFLPRRCAPRRPRDGRAGGGVAPMRPPEAGAPWNRAVGAGHGAGSKVPCSPPWQVWRTPSP